MAIQQQKINLLIVFLIFILLLLQGRYWLGEGSYTQVQNLKQAVLNQTQKRETLQERNQVLEAEVQDLKFQLGALQERARIDLGMIMQGETFFQDPDDNE